MPDLDLVFDFDGWKLNGVYIFSEPAAFAFLGTEDTEVTDLFVQPGFLERIRAGLKGQRIQTRRQLYDDYVFIYRKFGLCFIYAKNRVCQFEIHLISSSKLLSGFPGSFTFGSDKLELSSNSSLQDVKDKVGNPNEEDTEFGCIVYKNNYYELSFWFDEQQKLTRIGGSIFDNLEDQGTGKL
jgi:hypothetical protein